MFSSSFFFAHFIQFEIFSDRRLTKRKNMVSRAEKYWSHSELVIREHRTLERENTSAIMSVSRSTTKAQGANAGVDQATDEIDGDTDAERANTSRSPESRTRLVNQRTVDSLVDVKDDTYMQIPSVNTASEIAEEAALNDIDKLLVKRVLQLAVELETQARMLLLHALPKGSHEEVLLRADLVRMKLNFPFSLPTCRWLALLAPSKTGSQQVAPRRLKNKDKA